MCFAHSSSGFSACRIRTVAAVECSNLTYFSNIPSSEENLGDSLVELVEQSIPHPHQAALSNSRESLNPIDDTLSLCRELWGSDEQTCSSSRRFGRFDCFILLSPTPMAPEETMTTLCPSCRSLQAVSTMTESVESRGSWLFSSTMELVPTNGGVSGRGLLSAQAQAIQRTEFDDDGETCLLHLAESLTTAGIIKMIVGMIGIVSNCGPSLKSVTKTCRYIVTSYIWVPT